MISISQRPCRLGPKYSGKHQEAKDVAPERKTLKLQLTGIELDESEFNALFQSQHAWRLLHDNDKGVHKPSLELLKKFELKGLTSEGAHVVLWHSLGVERIEIAKAKLSKFTLTIADDEASGATTLAVTIEGEPPLNAKLAELIERLGGNIECEIRADHPNAQEDLPLNKHGTGEQGDRPRRRSSRGRQRLN